MNLELHIQIAGALQMVLAILHLTFPKRFHWDLELKRLSPLNRQIFNVHTIFIGVVLLMMGALSLFGSHALLGSPPLSRFVLIGFAIFWGLRLVFQWFVYDWSLWRGNTFNTIVHFVFTVFWMYLTAVYVMAAVLG